MSRSIRLCLLANVLLAGPLLFSTCIAAGSKETSLFETVQTSNAAILNRLGLAPLRFSDGHHKKRLAGPEPPLATQSRIHQQYGRRHGHRDSHVYVVKLPPSPPYYTLTKPHKSVKDDKSTRSESSLPVGFHSNGKPGKIYHWNLPVVKKIAEKKRILMQERMNQAKKKAEAAEKETKKQQQQQQQLGNTLQESNTSFEHLKKIMVDDARKQFHLDSGNGIVGHEITSKEHREKIFPGDGKRTRNNDKRLSYLETLEDLKKGVDEMESKQRNNNTNKTFRLEGTLLYKLNSHENDRIGWNLSDELLHGTRNTMNNQKLKKHRKKAAMSYYAPMTLKSGSTSIHKNFPGNGKPKAFYVIEKSRQPVYYHPLLP